MFKVKASRSGQELGTRIPVQCWEQKHGTLKTGFDGLVWIKNSKHPLCKTSKNTDFRSCQNVI